MSKSKEPTSFLPTLENSNDKKVYKTLEGLENPITRGDLHKKTNIPRSTLYDSLARLMMRGLVVSFSEERKQRGRPKVYYKLSPQDKTS